MNNTNHIQPKITQNISQNQLNKQRIVSKIKYRIIDISSEAEFNSSFELQKSELSNGWVSSRFCHFPQEIILQFITPIQLKQINILCHESKIPSHIEFFTFYQQEKQEKPSQFIQGNFNTLKFQSLGFIKMDSNEKTFYKARELRKIYVDCPSIYLKISLFKNHINRFNIFNQVGLISIECFGVIINDPRVSQIGGLGLIQPGNTGIAPGSFKASEDEMDDIALDKMKVYKQKLNEALKVEDYDTANALKQNIEKIKLLGRKILDLENQKKVSIENEDYDSAKFIKLEIERMRVALKNVEKGLPPIGSGSSENNDSGEFGVQIKDNAISGVGVNEIGFKDSTGFNANNSLRESNM